MTRVLVAVVTLCFMSATARAQAEEDDEEPPPKPGSKEPKKKKAPPPDEEASEEEPPERGKKSKPPPDADEEPSGTASASASASVSGGDFVEVGSPKARMTLPGGKFMLNVIGEANLAKGAAGKPLSIAPDLWFGLHDRLTFGIYHSGRAATGFLSGFGTGLCFRDEDMGQCSTGLGEVYTFAGAEARIGLTEGGFASALVLGGQARAFDPKLLAYAKGGFLVRLNSKRIAIELAPMVFIALTQRSAGMMMSAKDVFAAPVTLHLRFARSFSFALQAGITSTFKKFGDNYQVPAAAGLSWWVSPHFSIDAAFGLAAVLDKAPDTEPGTKPFDNRSATLGIGYAL